MKQLPLDFLEAFNSLEYGHGYAYLRGRNGESPHETWSVPMRDTWQQGRDHYIRSLVDVQ